VSEYIRALLREDQQRKAQEWLDLAEALSAVFAQTPNPARFLDP
jgi:hypothetical protein